MALNNRKSVSLYEEARAGISSLVKQTALVFVGLLIMLLFTRGAPSALVMSLSFFLGIGFVAFLEKQRQASYLSNSPAHMSALLRLAIVSFRMVIVLNAVILSIPLVTRRVRKPARKENKEAEANKP
jgi:hypothetical protein